MAARTAAAAHGSPFQCSFFAIFLYYLFVYHRFCEHSLHKPEPYGYWGPAPDTYYESLLSHAHPRRHSEIAGLSVDCCRVQEVVQTDKGEEAEAGMQVRCYVKAKKTTTQATFTDPISLQFQICSA